MPVQPLQYLGQTSVDLCENVPLDNDYKDTIYFDSELSQSTYFKGKATHVYEAQMSYQRVNHRVLDPYGRPNPRVPHSCRVDVVMDRIANCNYMFFYNRIDGMKEKVYYCFIDQINYINPNCSEIIYSIDVLQTYLFDVTINDSYVVREHCKDLQEDLDNIADEGFTVDDYVNRRAAGDVTPFDNSLLNIRIIIGRITNPITALGIRGIYHENAVSSGQLFGCGFIDYNEGSTESLVTNVVHDLGALNENDINIVGVIQYFKVEGIDPVTLHPRPTSKTIETNLPIHWTTDYKNLKCFKSPFTVYQMRTSDNEVLVLKPELFAPFDIDMTLKVERVVCLTDSQTFIYAPHDYANLPLATSSGISDNFYYHSIQASAGFQIPYSSDTYARWYAQNRAKLATTELIGTALFIAGSASGASAAFQAAEAATVLESGIASKTVAAEAESILGSSASAMRRGFGQAFGGLGTVAHIEATKADMRNRGETVYKGTPPTNVASLLGGVGCMFYVMSATDYRMKQIDDFFTRYGYAVNKLKKPNLDSRPHWNYVQLREPNITGSIPVWAMSAIKAIFSAGITLWKNGDEIGDYELDNSY